MLKLLVTTISFIIFIPAYGNWIPPENPDPEKIYESMKQDFVEKRFEDALAKQIWFHKNVLKYRQSFYGVRLSYALSHWIALGSEYPPALEALEEIRLETERKARAANKCCTNAFHDYASINRELGKHEETVHLFNWIDKNKPEYAERIFEIAKPALLAAGRHDSLVRYMNFDSALHKLQAHTTKKSKFC